MAAALPVVSTAVGGIPEMIQHGQSGFLAASGDAKALAEGLLNLQASADLRQRIAEKGRRIAEVKFSQSSMLRGYQDLYQEMLHDC